MSQPAVPQPPAPPEEEFGFTEQVKKPTFQEILRKPLTLAATGLAILVLGFILYLESGGVSGELPVPEVSYTLLPNEGKTSGVPIAIKLLSSAPGCQISRASSVFLQIFLSNSPSMPPAPEICWLYGQQISFEGRIKGNEQHHRSGTDDA